MAPKTPRQQQLDEFFENAVREEADQRVAAAVQEADQRTAAAVQQAVAEVEARAEAAQRRAAEAEARAEAAQLRIVQTNENLQNIQQLLQTHAQAHAQAEAQLTEAYRNLTNISQFASAALPPAGGLSLPRPATGGLHLPAPATGGVSKHLDQGSPIKKHGTKRMDADPNVGGPSKKPKGFQDGAATFVCRILHHQQTQSNKAGPSMKLKPVVDMSQDEKAAEMADIRTQMDRLEQDHGGLDENGKLKNLDNRKMPGRKYKDLKDRLELLKRLSGGAKAKEAEEEEADEEEAEEDEDDEEEDEEGEDEE